MTDPRDAHKAAVDAEVAAFRRSAAVIEQAKGVLVQLLAVDETQAFAILNRYSQDRNVKLHDLAERLVEAASRDRTPPKDVVDGTIVQLLDELTRADRDL